MAERVATEYVNATLSVTEAEMPRLIQMCKLQQLRLQVFVLEGGNQEVVLDDEAGGESIRLTFEHAAGRYRCSLTCRVKQRKLTDTLRRLVSTFKGDAVVNRIYPGFTMVYHYLNGAVVRIVECKGSEIRTVFEHHDRQGRLEAQYRLCTVEEEIRKIKTAIDALLDERNGRAAPSAEIDEKLKYHSRLLFALEA